MKSYKEEWEKYYLKTIFNFKYFKIISVGKIKDSNKTKEFKQFVLDNNHWTTPHYFLNPKNYVKSVIRLKWI